MKHTTQIPKPNREAIEAWLTHLPLANTKYCIDAMSATLQSLNAAADLVPPLRLDLAEMLRSDILNLVHRAEAYCIDSPLPYPSDIEHYADAGLRLHRELAAAYMAVAFDPRCPENRPAGSDRLVLSLYRGFQHLGLELLKIFQMYRSPGPEFWSIVYRLYRLGEARSVLAETVQDLEEPEALRTPLGQFKRILLFALANPFRLRQRDMAVMFEEIGARIDRVEWQQEPVYDEQTAEFVADLDAAQPPQRFKMPPGGKQTERYYLFTRGLVHDLVRLAKIPEGVRERNAPDPAVLIRVARSLAAAEKRRSTRRDERAVCRCVTGLSKLIGLLSLPIPQKEWTRVSKPQRALIEADFQLLPNDMATGEDALDSEGRVLRSEAQVVGEMGRTKASMAAAMAKQIWGGDPVPRPAGGAGKQVEGSIVSSGSRGFCIIWPSHPAAWLRVGDVIGVWENKTSLFIGAIRWLSSDPQGLRFGVELLAPAAQVVELYDNAAKSRGRALWLPMDPVLRPLPELLTVPGGLEVGTVVTVESARESGRYWVQSLAEMTPAFSRFALAGVAS
jgi:hypothetical protein